ncbi:MAG: undecaprenyl-diphosphate phosphatase [Deltaproteobacteria bacterium]|nr:undecaprenyl-diphosphate phosphatase [Deltaproteobacteria bacterium]
MTPLDAFILGLVEGITEYLPVSSTGHLILAGKLLGLQGEGPKAFEIVIQLGAVLAVVVHYRALLKQRLLGLAQRKPEAIRLAAGVFVAFLPAAIVGLAFHKQIKHYLFGPWPVSGAWIVGGVAMIAIERIRRSRGLQGEEGLEKIDMKRALWIGLGQCLSLWPGASRSMCTIVAGQLTGISTRTAADFSFLLALPTLGAATVYEFYKQREVLLASSGGWTTILIGLGVSFFVAWAVIASFLRYLQRKGLEPFGYYRIVMGVIVFWVLSAHPD